MNNPSPDDPDPLFDGLPEGPGHDAILDFVRRLEAARPELSEAAIARVQEAMRAEIRRTGRRRVWAVSAALATAAAVLLAVGLWRFAVRPSERPGEPPDVANVQPAPDVRPEARPPEPAPVEDRYRIKLAMPNGDYPSGRSLLATEEYGSLIGEMN